MTVALHGYVYVLCRCGWVLRHLGSGITNWWTCACALLVADAQSTS